MKTFQNQKKCFKRDLVLDWETMQVLKGGCVPRTVCELGIWQLSFGHIEVVLVFG